MKYYYLTAGGATAGPETLQSLTALMTGGTVSVATMVVPMGGEDWTPLARVLRFFYPDDSGATIGPVAFSELNRLNQIAALSGEAWVLEEGGTEWKVLSVVLAAGGVTAATPPPVMQLPRTVPDPHHSAAPSTATRTIVVRRRALGGLGRMPFFVVFVFVLFFSAGAVLLTARMSKMPLDGPTELNQILDIFQRHATGFGIAGLAASAVAMVALGLRVRNIGWPPLCLCAFLLPIALGLLIAFSNSPPWMTGVWFLSLLVAMIVFIPVSAMPPGYSRHRKLDTAGKMLAVLLLLLYSGAATWVSMNKKHFESELEKRRSKPSGQASPSPETPSAAHIQSIQVLTGGRLYDEILTWNPTAKHLLPSETTPSSVPASGS